jgi:hypothetical protein
VPTLHPSRPLPPCTTAPSPSPLFFFFFNNTVSRRRRGRRHIRSIPRAAPRAPLYPIPPCTLRPSRTSRPSSLPAACSSGAHPVVAVEQAGRWQRCGRHCARIASRRCARCRTTLPAACSSGAHPVVAVEQAGGRCPNFHLRRLDLPSTDFATLPHRPPTWLSWWLLCVGWCGTGVRFYCLRSVSPPPLLRVRVGCCAGGRPLATIPLLFGVVIFLGPE